MDKKAKRILFKTFWNNGWIDDRNIKIDDSDFAYAKEKGLMFDPLTISHDECIEKIVKLTNEISEKKIIKAFLSSLSSKRLDWRSGIASYHIGKKIEPHKYNPVESGHFYDDKGILTHTSYTCGICRDFRYGIIGEQYYENEDLNVLNFERIKWGGVRLGKLIYTLFDLQQFELADIREPTKEDIKIFKDILSVIEKSEPEDYPSTLEKNISKVFKSSKNERQVLLEILACIEILEPASYDRPRRGKNDWVYVEYWRGEDKYNKAAVDKYFGKYLN